jgi:hypothetical protein
MTINQAIYTFAASVSSNGQVLIGSTTAACAQNLCYAINNSGGTSGTDYLAYEGLAHPQVTATVSGSTITVTQESGLEPAFNGPVAATTWSFAGGTGLTATGMTAPDTDDTIDRGGAGGFGILRYRDGCHPANGVWGTPRRIHPNALNTKVEVFRLGRDLENYPFELPEAYMKYVYYYAMARLLAKDGPGQDVALAEHYMQRFESGVDRMIKRHDRMMPEHEGCFGTVSDGLPFALGDPQPSDDDIAAPA